MNRTFNKSEVILAILSFVLPFALFYATSANTLMFDDSAEFATVVCQGSIAHPPGTPAYILSAVTWLKITGLFHLPVIFSLTLFSGLCISLSSLFLFLTFRRLLLAGKATEENGMQSSWIAFFCAIGFASGPTSWAWANTIEVYAFQCLTMSLTLFALVHYNFKRNFLNLLLAGFAIALGLSNHHVTMIFFLPFVPFLFINDLFTGSHNEVNTKKKSAEKSKPILVQYIGILRDRKFWLLAGISALFTIAFYAWMFIRAQNEYLFMFSKPDTLDSLFFHLRGGAYAKNLTQTSKAIVSARIPFFLKLTIEQLGVFIPFLLIGIYSLYKSRRGKLAFIIITYYALLFIYQINNNQWASTDAYMLLPFILLMTGAIYGMQDLFSKWKLIYAIPILLLLSTGFHYPSHDRKTYPVGRELMDLLDKSSPQNSVVLISDWTTVMLYNYYHLIENFRPDLVVLNYDIKFTHYRIFPLQYPAFYSKVKTEYDAFVNELKKEHPYQAISTGCDLSTPELMALFRKLILKIESTAKDQQQAFLTDPRAHVFYMNEKIYSPNRYVSGCFMSTVPGDSISAEEFLNMDFKFLSSPLLFEDAGALDKLVDFQAMLDQHIASYKANNDFLRLSMAEKAHDKIMRLQREMKKNMSFAYKTK